MNKADKINLTFTILGPIIVLAFLGWMSWSFNARLTIDRQEEDKFNADTYVPQGWYRSGQTETNKRLDELAAELKEYGKQFSEMKGRLEGAGPMSHRVEETAK